MLLRKPSPRADDGADPSGAGERSEVSEHDQLTVVGGLAALSLDAMASVAYGPEAIVVVLAVAGARGLGFTLPVTLAIAFLLVILTLSYRQVIAAFPEGGGAYGVSRAHLGRRPSLVAAASLIVDYVLNVAVSVAAGVAALTSAVPELSRFTVELCLLVLAIVTVVNLRGVAHSARTFIAPTAVFVFSILLVIVVGLVRGHPAAQLQPGHEVASLQTVGVLLLLKAFANGCAALTGVEAIANAVPSFRRPRVRRAQMAEVALGALLATMLIGIAVLIEKFHVHPVSGVTVLSQVTAASVGDGIVYYLVQFSTVVLLALAANTSFGGLPVLAQLLARHNVLPHVFALQAERQVHRYGIGFLTVTSALLLIGSDGQMNVLVPLFAIGVFVGFTLSQIGMVRHWRQQRPPGWHGKALLNGTGAVLTGAAAIVVTATKFSEGGWLIVVTLPLLVIGMEWVGRAYDRIGERLRLGAVPEAPTHRRALVVVPVGAVTELTREAIGAAFSLGDRVVAVHVSHAADDPSTRQLVEQWDRWDPGVPLVLLHDRRRRLAEPLLDYLARISSDRPTSDRVVVLVAEVEPEHAWERLLQNQRGGVLTHALRRRTDAVVCRLRFPVEPRQPIG